MHPAVSGVVSIPLASSWSNISIMSESLTFPAVLVFGEEHFLGWHCVLVWNYKEWARTSYSIYYGLN